MGCVTGSGTRRALAFAAAFMVTLAGCGGARSMGAAGQAQAGTAFATCDANPNTCNSAEPSKLRQGGQLTYAIDKNVSNWNVLSSQGNVLQTGWVLSALLPRAFITAPDLIVAMNNDLLDSAKVTVTFPQTIVYKIKQNAIWSDGTPITADDFIYNWKVQNGRDCPNCGAASTRGYDQIKSVVGADNGKTVTVTFSKPFTDWKQLWGSGSPLYPAHLAVQHGDPKTPQGLAESFAWFGTAVPTYSGGPFQIDSFTDNESVVLTPNPKWYGSRPQLDRVTYRIIADANQQATALQNRQVQVIYPQPQVDQVQQVRKMAGVSSFVAPGLSWEHVDLNLTNPYLADPALRTAIFTAINRQEVIDKTIGQFTNKVKPLNSHNFVPQQGGYEDVISETGQGSGNLNLAKQILDASGYRVEGGQLRTAIGMIVPPLRMRYAAKNEVRKVECELIAQMVKPLGITITAVPADDVGAVISQGDFDMIVFSWVATPFPYSGAVQLWTSGQGSNFGRYNNPDVDRLVTAAASSPDEALAKEELNQADRRLTRDAYVLPLYQRPAFIALYNDVANIRNNSSLDGPQYNIAQWGLRAAG